MPNFVKADSSFKAGDFSRATARLVKAATAAVDAASEIVLGRAREIVPVDTGELVSSGGYTVEWKGKQVTGTISFTAEHAAYVEFGTGIRGASSPGAGPYAYNPDWPGMRAQPYLRPALDSSREEIRDEFSKQGFKLV